MPVEVLSKFHSANRALSRGELAIAAIHIAHTGLQHLPHGEDVPRTLFMAEKLLASGTGENTLLKALNLLPSGTAKEWHFNPDQPRDEHGRWTGPSDDNESEDQASDGDSDATVSGDNASGGDDDSGDSDGGDDSNDSGDDGHDTDTQDENAESQSPSPGPSSNPTDAATPYTPTGDVAQQIANALEGKGAIAFVGGFGDESISQIMENAAANFPNTNGAQIAYFTWDQQSELEDWINQQNTLTGGNVAVIGHSYGADTAATAVADGAQVSALITLDPVSQFPPSLSNVQNNAQTWINVYTDPDAAMRSQEEGIGNLLASMGGQWQNDPQGYATDHYVVNLNHADVSVLLPSKP